MRTNQSHVALYNQLQSFARLYTFRDPNVSCLFGLRVNECYVLDYVANYGALTVSRLADVLGIHKSNTSRIVAALESAGLVSLSRTADDGRTKTVELSPAGAAKHDEIQSYFVDRLRHVLEGFSPAEIESAKAVIAALTGDAENRILEVAEQQPA